MQTITMTATDLYGNSDQCTFDITLADSATLAISCPANQDEYVDNNCEFVIPDYRGLATVSGDTGVTQLPLIGTVISGHGTIQTITLTAHDGVGNSESCTFDITLIDTIIPTAVCQDITVQLDAAGAASIVAGDVDGGSSDACGISSLAIDISTFDCSDVGTPVTVTLTVTDNNGNSSTNTSTVTVEDITSPTITCPTDISTTGPAGSCSAVVTGLAPASVSDNCTGTSVSYSLSGSTIGTGTSDASGTSFNKGITTVWYKVTDISGNSDSCSFDVTVTTNVVPPDSAYTIPDQVCEGAATIDLMYGGGVMLEGGIAQWYDDAGLTNNIGSGSPLTITAPNVSTTYYVRFEGSCDTSAVVSTTVTIYPNPVPTITEKVENACASGPLYRYVVSGQASSTFSWTASGGTIANNYGDTIMVDWGSAYGSGSISVIETSSDGCVSDALTIDVQISGPDVELGDDQDICEGTPYTITPTGSFTVQAWHDGSTGTSYTTDTTEFVRIQVFDDAGCTAFDSVQITAYEVPVVDLGNDTVLCGDASLILDAGNPGSTYLWSTGESTQQITVVKGQQTISVEVSNFAGCTVEDELEIRMCSPKEFFANIANTITPNDDNVNDIWLIDEITAYPNADIEIYDRWGKMIWKSTPGYTVPWDGRNTEGKEMPVDSYFFVIHLNDGSDPINGTITIVR